MTTIKDIPRLSVSNLISIFHKKEGDAYTPGFLVAHRNSNDLGEREYSLSHPFSLNAFVLIYCISGAFSICTNDQTIPVRAGNLYINYPGQIMHVDKDKIETPLSVSTIVIDLDFIRNKNIDILPIANKLINLKNSQKIMLPKNSMTEMRTLIQAVSEEINNNDHDDESDSILRGLVSTLFFKIGRAVDKSQKETQSEEKVQDKTTSYFKEFIVHLSKHYKEQRTVGFYAEKMSLSPKYFTTVIKRASGHTVAEWIDHYVILEAKNLLKFSTMNVQEIAYSLNFPNQSFFGKYFKQHTGMSPSQHKKSK